MSQFVDFQGELPNTFFTWVRDDRDEIKFTSYHANHAIAGDTDSCYMKLPESLIDGLENDEIVQVCDEIGNLANQQFPDFMQHIFNCPEERKHTIQTDREAVSDRAFFLTKKRYIMHMIDFEGVPCDKNKVMGVELKKSDVPPATKVILQELVDMLFDGYTMEEVKAHIKEQKRTFSKRFTPMEIARPMSCKTLGKCEKEFAMTNSLKGFPYQVRASMFYNGLCGDRDQRIRSGEKIRLLYIKNPQSKYIALPSTIEEMPSWFEEIDIDYDTMWAKTYKKVRNYFEALDWDVKSIKDNKRNELFGF